MGSQRVGHNWSDSVAAAAAANLLGEWMPQHERRHGSPAPLVCLRALRNILVHPVFVETLFSHNIALQGKSTDSSGAHSKNKDLFSLKVEVPVWTSRGKVCYSPMGWTFKRTFFYSRQVLYYGLLELNLLLRHILLRSFPPFFGLVACGIFPNQGLNPHSLQWELGVLITGPPGKSYITS